MFPYGLAERNRKRNIMDVDSLSYHYLRVQYHLK